MVCRVIWVPTIRDVYKANRLETKTKAKAKTRGFVAKVSAFKTKVEVKNWPRGQGRGLNITAFNLTVNHVQMYYCSTRDRNNGWTAAEV